MEAMEMCWRTLEESSAGVWQIVNHRPTHIKEHQFVVKMIRSVRPQYSNRVEKVSKLPNALIKPLLKQLPQNSPNLLFIRFFNENFPMDASYLQYKILPMQAERTL